MAVLDPEKPALILAPMEGMTDAPMRALMGSIGAFSFAVSEFVRVSAAPIPGKVFRRIVPELAHAGRTPTGMPVQVQILGGDPERVALSAVAAVRAGAWGIDLNFGCPARTVNRNDGGASLLREPRRIRELVAAVRGALPPDVPVSAKIRLGWDSVESVYENAAMAAEGGAAWLTIHARTRTQGYAPPVYWEPVAQVRASLSIPVVANGDIWSVEDFQRCRDVTGCRHFMLGRGALADPSLSLRIACEMGCRTGLPANHGWLELLTALAEWTDRVAPAPPHVVLKRMKQWLQLAHQRGKFAHFDAAKRAETIEELLAGVSSCRSSSRS